VNIARQDSELLNDALNKPKSMFLKSKVLFCKDLILEVSIISLIHIISSINLK
jgi:hypothetical protein